MSKIFNIETGPDWSQIPDHHHIVVQNGDKTLVSTNHELEFDKTQNTWVVVDSIKKVVYTDVEFYYSDLYTYLTLHPEYKTKIWRR